MKLIHVPWKLHTVLHLIINQPENVFLFFLNSTHLKLIMLNACSCNYSLILSFNNIATENYYIIESQKC